jgi:hypothetical protein
MRLARIQGASRIARGLSETLGSAEVVEWRIALSRIRRARRALALLLSGRRLRALLSQLAGPATRAMTEAGPACPLPDDKESLPPCDDRATEIPAPAAATNRLDRPADVVLDHLLGPSDAPITLVGYGSYACPYCRAANERIAEVRSQLGERLRYVLRHRPHTPTFFINGRRYNGPWDESSFADAGTIEKSVWPTST